MSNPIDHRAVEQCLTEHVIPLFCHIAAIAEQTQHVPEAERAAVAEAVRQAAAEARRIIAEARAILSGESIQRLRESLPPLFRPSAN
jgi:hypothetical protein